MRCFLEEGTFFIILYLEFFYLMQQKIFCGTKIDFLNFLGYV